MEYLIGKLEERNNLHLHIKVLFNQNFGHIMSLHLNICKLSQHAEGGCGVLVFEMLATVVTTGVSSADLFVNFK